MRRFALPLALVWLLVLFGATAFTASAAPLRSATTAATMTPVTLTGSVAGGIKSADVLFPVAFTFTLKNTSTTTVEYFLVVRDVAGASDVHNGCVFPGTSYETSGDGFFCEPQSLLPGQRVKEFVSALNAGTASAVSVQACANNPDTGSFGPCLTLSVKNTGI
jgi:hypothetical protein